MNSAPRIDSVQPTGMLGLLVTFRNGDLRLYDCAPLLSRPHFRLLADPGFRQAVKVDAGGYGVSWNDDIDLSEYELWTNGLPITHQAAAT